MRIESLVKAPPVTLRGGASLKEAAQLFAKNKIGLLVITSSDDPKRAEGVISERDVVRALASGRSLSDPVDAVSTKKLITVMRSDPLPKALKKMLNHNIRHLVVENYDGSLYGVVSVRDFLREGKILEELMKEEARNSVETD